MTARPWPAALVLLAASVPLADLLFAAPQERKPRKVAFLVGVGEFKHDPKPLGESPKKDVTALAKVLEAGGFEVVVLTDAQATKENIEARFKAILDGGGKRDAALGNKDLLLVALCSHGFTIEVNRPNKEKTIEPFIAGHDSRVGEAESMVSLNDLIEKAAGFAPTTLFLVDACREVNDPNRGTRGIEGKQVKLPKRTAVLFACGEGQLSHQSEKAGGGHGLFTFAVLKTLQSGGGDDWDGLVAGVKRAFQSGEFKAMLPAGAKQVPVQATGELEFIELLSTKPAPPKKSADPPSPGNDIAKGGPPAGDMEKVRPLPGLSEEPFQYTVNDTGTRAGKRKVLRIDIGGGQTMEFVRIEKGDFKMGAPADEKNAFGSEQPQRKVTISKAFYLGKFEVTQAQYQAVMSGSNPSHFKGDTLPVENVSWDDAAEFCKKLSEKTGRKIDLPTEAQWEYACRAETETPFHFGSKLRGDHANHDGRYPYGYGPSEKAKAALDRTAPVGTVGKANPWGLHDMHGNVQEWCRDYHGTYDKIAALTDPFQDQDQGKGQRVLRGGSWFNDGGFCRSASRVASPPNERDNKRGFRVSMPAD